MSVNPLLAAAVGVIVLGQRLGAPGWCDIAAIVAAIVAANAVSRLAPST